MIDRAKNTIISGAVRQVDKTELHALVQTSPSRMTVSSLISYFVRFAIALGHGNFRELTDMQPEQAAKIMCAALSCRSDGK